MPRSDAQTEPWLSVVVPLYNGGKWVAQALTSVVRSLEATPAIEWPDVEVVVVDDGSSDNGLDVVRTFSDQLRLVVLPSERMGSWVATTNRGVAAASGRWISFLHQDDHWLPGRLATLASLAPDCSLIVTSTVFVDSDGADLGPWQLPWKGDRISGPDFARRLYVQNFLSVPSVAVRADVLRSVGPLDESLWYTADWDLWMRLAAVAEIRSEHAATVAFRVHDASQTSTGSRDGRDYRSQLESILATHSTAADGSARRSTVAAGRASIEVNVALAALSHGQRPQLGPLMSSLVRVAPPGRAHRLLRDSRIVERTRARLRARRRSASVVEAAEPAAVR